MKRQNIKLLMYSALVIALPSCLKKQPINIDPSNNGIANIVEFGNTGGNNASSASKYPRFFSDLGTLQLGQSTTFNVNVDYAGAENAPEDITVNLGLDMDGLTLYNNTDGTSYEVPPASVYTFPSSVVIKKGTRTVQTQVSIEVNGDYDFNAAYALPLKITSASMGTISGNFGTAIYSFGARNIYDGVYIVKGYFTHPNASYTGAFYASEVDMYTVGATSIEMDGQPFNYNGSLAFFGVYPVLTINPDNSVGVDNLPDGGQAPSFSDPTYNNHYDPATKTFFINYSYNLTAPRIAYDTCIYVRPR